MILADTSVWVAHLKRPGGHPELIAALEEGEMSTHPFVEGELHLSGAPSKVLLAGVPMLPAVSHREVMAFVATVPRPIRGLGWVDVHLVYAALAHRHRLLTLDRAQASFYRQLTGRPLEE